MGFWVGFCECLGEQHVAEVIKGKLASAWSFTMDMHSWGPEPPRKDHGYPEAIMQERYIRDWEKCPGNPAVPASSCLSLSNPGTRRE